MNDVRDHTPLENALDGLKSTVSVIEKELTEYFELGTNALRSWNGLINSLEFLILHIKRFDASFDVSFYSNDEPVPSELEDMFNAYHKAILQRYVPLAKSTPENPSNEDDIPF